MGGLVLKDREPSGGQFGKVHEGRAGFGSLDWEVATVLCEFCSKVQGSVFPKHSSFYPNKNFACVKRK